MIRAFLSFYNFYFPRTIVYMLQASEYQVWPYVKWFWRTNDLSKVMYRKQLVITRPAKLLLAAAFGGMIAQYLTAAALFIWGVNHDSPGLPQMAIAIFLISPVLWAHLIILPLLAGRFFLSGPSQQAKIWRSKTAFKKHLAIKIAVAGSYGKTTMKEMLLSVLSEGKKVAATPANKNVAISHAVFAGALDGGEEILIIEFGEGAPGDVAKFSRRVKPDIGIITGLAPAHLDKYKTLARAGKDIFSLASYLNDKNIYVNAESESLKPFIKRSHVLYNSEKAGRWKIYKIKSGIDGLSFDMKNGAKVLRINSSLIGRHQVGPLAAVAVLADKLGLSAAQIESGIKKIQPFEHRMQPQKTGGAWLIDDTYNGNIEGMRAGLALLKEQKATRKIYVTPGLVDQGKNSSKIHQELGQVIAKAKPDITVLMKHSVTNDIIKGLEAEKYKGELRIEEKPLNFYTNLDKFMAAGDLVLMQNDWPDNYS